MSKLVSCRLPRHLLRNVPRNDMILLGISMNKEPVFISKTLQVDENISIIEAEVKYAEAIYEELDVSSEDLKDWLPFAEDATLESTIDYISNNKANVILYQGNPVGMTGIADANLEEGWCELGYWLSSNHTGKGIVTKCCRAMMDYCFNVLKCDTVIIKCDKKNKKSAAVAERLGYDEKTETSNELYQGKIRDTLIHKFYRK